MKTQRRRRFRKGSFLLVAMIVALALSTIVASFITLSTTSVKITEANFTGHATQNPGEEALDRGFSAIGAYVDVLRGGTDTLQPDLQPDANKLLTDSGWDLIKNDGKTLTFTRYLNNNNSPAAEGLPIALGNGRTATVRVTIRNIPSATNQMAALSRPEILAEVIYAPTDTLFSGTGYTRQFYARTTWPPTNIAAMLARNLLTNNGKVSVDSFSGSNVPTGDPGPSTLYSRDNAYVACTEEAIGVSGGVAQIYGYTATQSNTLSDISFKGSAHVWGDYGNLNGANGNIVEDYYADMNPNLVSSGVDPHRLLSDFNVPSNIGTNLTYNTRSVENGEDPNHPVADTDISSSTVQVDPVTGKKTLTLNGGDGGGYYIVPAGGLTIGSGSTVERLVILGRVKILASDSTTLGKFTTSGILGDTSTAADAIPGILVKAGGELYVTPSDPTNTNTLAIYSAGHIDTSGGSIINDPGSGTTSNATAFTIFGKNLNKGDSSKSGAQAITMGGASNNVACIRAPNANVIIGGTKGTMVGAVLAYNITLNGSIAFHYDERLSNTPNFSPLLSNWMELKGDKKKTFADFK